MLSCASRPMLRRACRLIRRINVPKTHSTASSGMPSRVHRSPTRLGPSARFGTTTELASAACRLPPWVSRGVREEPLLDQFTSEFGVKSCSTPFEQGILEDHTTGTEQALYPQGGFAVACFDQEGAARL